jgi:threonine aldolase
MDFVDLRSDTVTRPTPEMREAMAVAEVGDDVYAEDPTVNHLQELAARRTGKEAALFVASGTMGNMVAMLGHCRRGDEAIMGNLSHTFVYEGGGVSALGGVQPFTLPNRPDGTLDLQAIRMAIRDDDPHYPTSRLIILENTHNLCGGVPLTVEYTRQVAAIAQEKGLKLHIDGARLFNAAIALGVDASDLSSPADTVTFCLSKALCAPVGSVICGSKEFIHQAIRVRKQLGGGMRQAGILAAAGIIALDQMVDRLADDHARAKRLARELQAFNTLSFPLGQPQTNMVFMDLADDYPATLTETVARLAELGVRVDTAGPRRFRLVTHYWINDEGVEKTIQAFKSVIG